MSYKHIFRRASRILKSKVNDAAETIFSEKKELDDFEQELKKSSQQKNQEQSSSSQTRNKTHSQQRQREQQYARTKKGEMTDEECFAVLGLKSNATNEQIKFAYKKLITQYHPDKVANLGSELQELASKKTKEINEAYQTLKKRRG